MRFREVLLLCLLKNIQVAQSQKKVAIFNETVVFSFFDVDVNFIEAKQLCVDNNSILARVSNKEEFDFIVEEFSEGLDLKNDDDFWIGKEMLFIICPLCLTY